MGEQVSSSKALPRGNYVPTKMMDRQAGAMGSITMKSEGFRFGNLREVWKALGFC